MARTRPTAFGYVRVSGRGQVEGHGFERQETAIRSYCKGHRLNLAEVFQEKGVSGSKGLEDRPALSELFSKILGNGTSVVVVERADRLARDLI